MASPIEAMLLLADAAQVDGHGGKVHLLGAGWSVTGSPTAPQAVVGLLKIPWDRTNTPLAMRLQLVDADGQEVALVDAEGEGHTLDFASTLEVGRPPGLPPGTPIDSSFVVNVPSLPLPGGRFGWRLQVGDEVFLTSFSVRGEGL